MRIAIVLLLAAAVARADQLIEYGKRTYASDNGQWLLETEASGTKLKFVLRNKDGRVRGKGELDHLPVAAAVFADGGGFVFWGRYLREGSGIGVARYDYDGKLRWSHEFKKMFDDAERAGFPRTLSFILWADDVWIDHRRGLVVGTTRSRSVRIFDLQDGTMRPGAMTIILESLSIEPPPRAAIETAAAWFPDRARKRLEEIAADEQLPMASRLAALAAGKPDERHAKLLRDALDDPAAAPVAVRAAARALPRDEARELLVRAATHEALGPDAVGELARMGDVEGLVEVLAHGEVAADAKRIAAATLRNHPLDKVAPAVLEEFDDADLDTAALMLDTLAAIGDRSLPRLLQPHQQKLIRLLGRKDAPIGFLATVFTQYPTTEALRALLKAAHANPGERKALFAAMRACSGLKIGDDLAAWDRAVR